MVAAKGLVLLCATVLLARGHNVTKRGTFDQTAYAGTPEEADTAAKAIISAGVAEVESVANKAEATLREFIEAAKSEQTQIQTKIDSIVKNAGDKNSARAGDKACIETKMADVKELGDTSVVHITDCQKDKVTLLENLLSEVVAKREKVVTLAPTAAAAIDECKKTGGIFESVCIGRAALDFKSTLDSVIPSINNIAETAQMLQTSKSDQLSECMAAGEALLALASVKLLDSCNAKIM